MGYSLTHARSAVASFLMTVGTGLLPFQSPNHQSQNTDGTVDMMHVVSECSDAAAAAMYCDVVCAVYIRGMCFCCRYSELSPGVLRVRLSSACR